MLNIGDTIENGRYRIHRYNSSIRIVELENAGKRGKKCAELVAYNLDGHCGYNVVAGGPEMIAEKAEAGLDLGVIEMVAKVVGAAVDRRDLRGVDVPAAGFKPIRIDGANVYIEAGHEGFRVADKRDRNNLPTLIAPGKGAKKAVAAFYRYIERAPEGAFANATFSEVWNALGEAGIEAHYYCAMD